MVYADAVCQQKRQRVVDRKPVRKADCRKSERVTPAAVEKPSRENQQRGDAGQKHGSEQRSKNASARAIQLSKTKRQAAYCSHYHQDGK